MDSETGSRLDPPSLSQEVDGMRDDLIADLDKTRKKEFGRDRRHIGRIERVVRCGYKVNLPA